MEQKKPDLYKQDGVNVNAGDVFSAFAADICRSTYHQSPFVEIFDLAGGNFRGARGYRFKNLPDGCVETGVMDGIGTKVVPIDAARDYINASANLIAMTRMDITRYGGLGLIFMSIFDVRTLGEIGSETFRAAQLLMLGLNRIAKEERIVLLGGESAELGACVGSENPGANLMFNWGGHMCGVYHPKKMILGDTLKSGQIIIALADFFRSNGISSVRKALAIQYGQYWWNNPHALKDILEASTPSVLYDTMLNAVHGWYNPPTFKPLVKMHAIVHLTGGSFESKLGNDILKPRGLRAELTDLFNPPEIMRKCGEWRGMSDEDFYRVWNGGQGALVIVDKKEVKKFLKIASNSGIRARIAGQIVEKKDSNSYSVHINSKYNRGETVRF